MSQPPRANNLFAGSVRFPAPVLPKRIPRGPHPHQRPPASHPCCSKPPASLPRAEVIPGSARQSRGSAPGTSLNHARGPGSRRAVTGNGSRSDRLRISVLARPDVWQVVRFEVSGDTRVLHQQGGDRFPSPGQAGRLPDPGSRLCEKDRTCAVAALGNREKGSADRRRTVNNTFIRQLGCRPAKVGAESAPWRGTLGGYRRALTRRNSPDECIPSGPPGAVVPQPTRTPG